MAHTNLFSEKKGDFLKENALLSNNAEKLKKNPTQK